MESKYKKHQKNACVFSIYRLLKIKIFSPKFRQKIKSLYRLQRQFKSSTHYWDTVFVHEALKICAHISLCSHIHIWCKITVLISPYIWQRWPILLTTFPASEIRIRWIFILLYFHFWTSYRNKLRCIHGCCVKGNFCSYLCRTWMTVKRIFHRIGIVRESPLVKWVPTHGTTG